MQPRLPELHDFATHYTAAWCSQHPESVAAFFSPDGSLRVNDDPAAVGRSAITQVAQSFMTAFPDLTVMIGTNTGPSGTGRRVRISGFEKWCFGSDGLIASSQGRFDAHEYCRQLQEGI
jgi:hypothetical protein